VLAPPARGVNWGVGVSSRCQTLTRSVIGAVEPAEALDRILHCLDRGRLGRQRAEIDEVWAEVAPFRVLTEQMVRVVCSPHVDVLGHCTGRMIDKPVPWSFDAAAVFAACAESATAVEINCRPERLDPPDELLAMALDVDRLLAWTAC
jgi:hypothetical protein